MNNECLTRFLYRKDRGALADGGLETKIRRMTVSLINLDELPPHRGLSHFVDLFREDLPLGSILAESDATVVVSDSGDISCAPVTFTAIATGFLCSVMVWAELSDGSRPVMAINDTCLLSNDSDITFVL